MARYAIGNFSKKYPSKIMKKFEKIEKLPYEKKRPKHEPTESCFRLSIQIAKCMMRSDNLNWHYHGGYTEMTALSLNVNSTDEDESKRIIVHKGLSDNFSTDVSKSKRNTVNETLSHNNSKEISEYNNTELKDKDYKEPSVTKEVTSYFDMFECGRNLLDKLDVTYQRAFMSTPKYKYYNVFLGTLVKDNNSKGEPLSNDKIRQAVGKVIEETEAKFEYNYNKITCDTSFQSPLLKKYLSTINDSVYYESDEQVDTISDSNKHVDPSSDPKEETHIIDIIRKLSVRQLFNPAVIRVIGQDLVTNGQENSRSTQLCRRRSLLARHAKSRRLIGTL